MCQHLGQAATKHYAASHTLYKPIVSVDSSCRSPLQMVMELKRINVLESIYFVQSVTVGKLEVPCATAHVPTWLRFTSILSHWVATDPDLLCHA